MVKFIKNWTLPIAMSIGAIGYQIFYQFMFLMPYLLFSMLLLTFCKVSFKELKFEPLHLWLLLIQFIGSFVVFAILYPFNKVLAESAMLCVIAPTAAAAAVVTGKLGGDVPCLTMYTLLSSMLTAILVPMFFPIVAGLPPYIDAHVNNNFFISILIIMNHVFPVVVLPLIIAWLLRTFWPDLHDKLSNISGVSFYLWACSLVCITAVTVKSLIASKDCVTVEILSALLGLAICCFQFFLGKRIGSHYGERISGGQGLGQKSTILVIWISQVYLNPISSLGACSYVIWQNSINSWQLWQKRKKDAQAQFLSYKYEKQ
jgi:bile acid:Na+ symporter, BASS family